MSLGVPVAPVEALLPGPASRPALQTNAIVALACLGAAVAGLVLTPTLEQVTAL